MQEVQEHKKVKINGISEKEKPGKKDQLGPRGTLQKAFGQTSQCQ